MIIQKVLWVLQESQAVMLKWIKEQTVKNLRGVTGWLVDGVIGIRVTEPKPAAVTEKFPVTYCLCVVTTKSYVRPGTR